MVVFVSAGTELPFASFTLLPLDRKSLCQAIVNVCIKKKKDIEEELHKLEEERINSRYWDDTDEFHQKERIGFLTGKYVSIIERMDKYINLE